MSNKLKTKILDFINNTDIDGQIAQESTAPGHWPETIFSIFNNEATSFAKIRSKFLGNATQIAKLQTHITNGTVPDSLTLKFKKLYTKEDEVATRTAVITAAINQEIASFNTKNQELNALFQDRYNFTANKFQNFAQFGVIVDNLYTRAILDFLVRDLLVQFSYKTSKDLEAKAKKQEKFAALKEAEATPIALNKKQLTKMESVMKSLQSQVASLKLKKNQGNAKGSKPKVQSSPQKGKGTKKPNGKKNGKKSNSANTKRSRGKNSN